jgi:regulator of protease activity HflC (stomatin/prohibitin superfamily)
MTPFFIILAVFVVILAVRGLLIVKQSETIVVERLGRFHRTLDSGINVIWPIIDTPRAVEWRYIRRDPDGRVTIRNTTVNRIDLRETVYDFPKQNVITRDNVAIEINALIYFQIIDAKRAVYEIANLPDAMEKLTQTTLRNVVGELDLDHTLTSRDTINAKLRAILDEATYKWGVKVNRVEIQDITPPDDVKLAMEKQMRAERDRRAMILEAEGHKQAKILEAEGQRQSEVNRAEGERQALALRAAGDAEAKVKVAEAEAEAIRKISAAIRDAGGDASQYLIALKYLEAMKEMAAGKDSKLVYLPYESSALMGAVGSLKDVFSAKTIKS